jgi:hypothetical protein
MCIQIKIGKEIKTFNDKLDAITFIVQQDEAYLDVLRKSLAQANAGQLVKREF